MSLDWADGCEEREARWSEPCDSSAEPCDTDAPCVRCGESTARGAYRIPSPLGDWFPLCGDCLEEVQRPLAL